MLNDFIEYLKNQVGQPYVWGGQHTKLTKDNYKRIINKKEAGTGYYPYGVSYAQAAINYCDKKFDEGYEVLYAYDCSGLGSYWLYNLMHLYKADTNANTMMHKCILKKEIPKKGWWVFRLSGKRASHIGYMIDDDYLIEAKGRTYGVVKNKFNEKDWDCWGIPKIFKDELIIESTDYKTVQVIGGSVNVRTSDSKKGRIMFTAHKGDKFPYLETSETGWYKILTVKGIGYITNLKRYTELLEE